MRWYPEPWVLGGKPPGERGDLGAHRRAARVVRVDPLLSDQATMPSQNGARCDQPVCLQPSRQLPDQRGQYRPAGPVQPGPRIASAQHSNLVPQDQPAIEPDEYQVDQAKRHG
jgi:hypothetical protein